MSQFYFYLTELCRNFPCPGGGEEERIQNVQKEPRYPRHSLVLSPPPLAMLFVPFSTKPFVDDGNFLQVYRCLPFLRRVSNGRVYK
jgi:hypothetical protein